MSGFSFGQAQKPASLFGQSTTGMSQQPAAGFAGFASSTNNPPPAFGATSNPPPAFGATSNPPPAFGATSTPAFGVASSTPSFGITSGVPVPGGTAGSTGFSFGAPGPAAASTGAAPTAGAGFGGFSMGTPASSAAAPTSTGFGGFSSFGAPPVATTAPVSASGGLFSGFGTSSTAPSTGFSMGAQSTAPRAGFQLGAPATSTAPSTSAPAPSFGFGAPSASTAAPAPVSSTTTTAAPAPAGFSLSSFGAPSAASTAATSTAPAATSAAPTVSFGLPTSVATSVPAASAATTAAPATSVPSFGFGVGFGSASTAATTSALTTATTTAAATGQATAAQKTITFKDLEDMVNQWHLVLDEQEKMYLEQATQVNAWDRLLIANAEKIESISAASDHLKFDQDRMEQELDFVTGQQRELEDMLKPLEDALEKEMGSMDMTAINDPLTTDGQRTAIYRSAVDLDAHLKTMSDDLKEIIDSVNARTELETAGAAQEAELAEKDKDPLMQFCQVLNAHMDSIHWLDSTMQGIKEGLDGLDKERKIRIAAQTPKRSQFL